MRFHRAFAMVELAQRDRLESIARAETLCSVRLEPILRQGKPLALVELRFAAEGRAAVVPFVFVDVAMLLDPERDALVWPASFAAAVSDRAADGIANLVVPWIVAESLGRPLNSERTLLLGDAAEHELFALARERGAIGAACAADSLLRAAPFVYAERFRLGRTFGVAGPDAALGFALARCNGDNVIMAQECEPASDPLVRWYGIEPITSPDPRDLVIEPAGSASTFAAGTSERAVRIAVRSDFGGAVPLIVPSPTDAIFPFDRVDGSLGGSLDILGAIPETPPAHRSHQPSNATGTSGGRIFFAVRDARSPYDDADIDEAFALAQSLRAEGFEVEVGDDPARITPGAFDLVHVHGLLEAPLALLFLRAAKAASIPTALHAHAEEASLGGWWGTVVTRYCFEYAADQRSIDDFTALLRQRRLALGEVRADRPFAPPEHADSAIRAAIRLADVVFVSGEAEAAFLERTYGRSGNVHIVPPAVTLEVEPAPIGAIVGSRNFALMHGPIGARGNQILAMRAADQAKIPLVVAGRVTDPSYLALLREFGGANTRILTDPSPEQLSALYAGATVFADLAWVSAGRSRAARAAIGGSRLVLADRRPLDLVLAGEGVTRVDPGDEPGAVRALGDAWYAATESRFPSPIGAHVYAHTVPRAVAAAVASGYALLAQTGSGSHE